MKEPKKLPITMGMTPNTAQRRPNAPKHSKPIPFSIKPSGKK